MTVATEKRGDRIVLEDSLASKGLERMEHKGRSYWDVTKLVMKVFAGVALGVFGFLSIAALITGILLLINPAGFGLGNLLGAGLNIAAGAIAIWTTKAIAVLSSNAVLITIFSAIGLGITAAAASGFTVATICSKDKRGEESDKGIQNQKNEDDRTYSDVESEEDEVVVPT